MKAAVVLCLAVLALPLAAQTKRPALTDQEKSINDGLRGLRAVPDAQRGEVTRKLALEIRGLPESSPNKLALANGLANLSTEGDFGAGTLQEVGATLAAAITEKPNVPGSTYSELASLVRYEGVHVSLKNAQFDAAMKELEDQDRSRAAADFTVADLNGKQWHLRDLRGKVVLVNFWATWCPPCRKEMPDLDVLYKQFAKQGLVILAFSDEDVSKVKPFLAEHPVSYPVLLDPGRVVNKMYFVEGIPKSFVYDREGKLVAQSIDMRTRGQFLEMLKRAGLQPTD